MGWDELVIDAVSEHYGLDRAMMTLPKKEKPVKATPASEQPPAEETAPEQPATIKQRQPANEAPKKKGKGKGGEK